MGRKLHGKTGATLGLLSSNDYYNKFLRESEILKEEWNALDATNFLITAWHLFNDWIKSESKRTLTRTKRNRSNLPSQMNLVLDVTRDLVNGSKHFELDSRSVQNRKVTEVHDGLEAGWFSYFFHENIAGVSLEGGWYFSVRVLHNILVTYYEWVFDDSQLPKEFPKELLEAINYCNVKNRDKMPVPFIWAKHL